MNENTVDGRTMKIAEKNRVPFVQAKWWIFMMEGLLFLVLGGLSISIPQLFSIIDTMFLGWLLVVGGLAQLSRTFLLSTMPGFVQWLLLGLLQITAGALLIVQPDTGVITITSVLAIWFAYEGSIKIYLAIMENAFPNNKMMLFSGITSFIFALVMMAFWPEIDHWILGVLIGINMIILGLTLIKVSLLQREKLI